MASAFRSSTRCRSGLNCASGATVTSTTCAFSDGVTDAPLKMSDRQRQEGHRGYVPAEPETFHNVTDFVYETLEHRLRELAFLNSGVHVILTDNRHADQRARRWSTKVGSAHSCRISIAPSRAARCARHDDRRKDGLTVETACGGTRATTRTCCASPTTFRSATAARTWPASGRADPRSSTSTPKPRASRRRKRSRSPATTRAKG